MRIALNLYIALGSMEILTILFFSIHEHGVPFHLFVSFSIFHQRFIVFSVQSFHLPG